MKAFAIWPTSKRSGLVDIDEPRLATATDVRVRILDVGVCGTDAEICGFQYGTPPEGDDFLVMGHEALGEVVEVGAGVRSVAPGDLVVPMVRRPCPHARCAACRAGYQDFCITGDYTERGIKGAHGFLAEQIVEDERYLAKLPPGLRDAGVLIEPLTIAEKALEQYADVQRRLPWQQDAADEALMLGRTALVLGAGPVGLLGAMLLVGRGFTTVVYSRRPAPNAESTLLKEVGAEYASSSETPVPELVKRLGRVDLVYEAAGASQFAFEVLSALDANGVFIFTGVPGRKQPIEIDGGTIMKNVVLLNQAVIGTVNAGRGAFEAAVRDLGEFARVWPGAVRSIITHRHPMAEFCESAAEEDGIKHVISVWGRG